MAADAEHLDNQAINAAIRHAAETTNFAERLLAAGKPAVYMDDDGRMVTRRPGRDHEEAGC